MGEADPNAGHEPSLDEVRARIDAVDAQLLHLLDERTALAQAVARAKDAAGDRGFGLRPGRETAVLRRLLAQPRDAARTPLVVRIWRELMSENLALQGPFQLAAWGGREPTRVIELARQRFGAAPSLLVLDTPEAALAAAKTPGGVAVLGLAADSAWWGRLLAERRLRVFSALPCLAAWGPTGALAVAEVEVEPTGDDVTFWVTDAPGRSDAIAAALGRDGVAASLLVEARGLKLFSLAGFHQPQDERLARAPGGLSGVIGAAPAPFDV